MGRLQGKVAIITGAGSGIGEATARRFAAEGAYLLVQSRQTSKAEATVAAIRDAGGTGAAIWDRTLSVNLLALALMRKYAIPHMVAGGGGSILFSGFGRSSQRDMLYTAYAAVKAGQ
ncbi:NAD(P)-dependent dehydrogenase (short-subunit alcohol dehydrogenase family) [Sphingobium fontiphilum]|uniref:NAD(P)-dependent dehydrogenase (Short-subunit alcohol dehydrogenase family) n=1 Tax=Sphingobium fontiphilum TaxID=944425 RepID=A0A7W6DLY5_9SPHN|nr:SDR family NAD(P)-dependent oxidoreductase [Sphingobium fontiphilum]MBB3982303.1 NAD(P)-dependent dehydrogenase (short-subunit alcohol dehydrogenase family) [Sphingobium fontiphilum]